jgi:hypothetical protein
MRLRAVAGGLTPAERADSITDRLVRLVAVPDLTPADVVVYTPDHRPPVIYVLGRKLITVDTATAAASGIGTPLDTATTWAKRLQQVLPRVDIRLPSEPEPVVPVDPPLTTTSNFDAVGGSVGSVILRDKIVMRLRGPQSHGMTAAERADLLGAQLSQALHATDNLQPSDIDVVLAPPAPARKLVASVKSILHTSIPAGEGKEVGGGEAASQFPSAILMVGTREIVEVDVGDASAAGIASPKLLAESWAKNIRNVVFPPPKPVIIPPASATTAPLPSPAPTPPVDTAPAPQVPTPSGAGTPGGN